MYVKETQKYMLKKLKLCYKKKNQSEIGYKKCRDLTHLRRLVGLVLLLVADDSPVVVNRPEAENLRMNY